MMWSHHEKLCLVDNRVAAMGGLDACFGRWDTPNHELADVHPQNFYKTLYPGQDYNNSRLMDFQTVDQFTSNALAIQDAGEFGVISLNRHARLIAFGQLECPGTTIR